MRARIYRPAKNAMQGPPLFGVVGRKVGAEPGFGYSDALKGQGANEFAADDIAALEMCSTFGALSLYWCQGLGALHNKLERSANKMKQLEKAVVALKDKEK